MLMAPGELEGKAVVPTVTGSASEQQLVSVKSRKYTLDRKTRMEKRLIVVVVLLILVLIALIIALAVVKNKYQKKVKTNKYCNAEECIDASSSLLQAMDRSVNPCQNFYKFACGRWSEEHPIPENQISNSWFSEKSKHLYRLMQNVMEKNVSDTEPDSMWNLRTLYQCCSDTDGLEKADLQPLLEVLQNVSLSTTVPSNTTSEGYNIARSIAQAQRHMSLDLLILLSPGHFNTSIRVLKLSPAASVSFLTNLIPNPDEDLPLSQLTAKQVIKANLHYMIKVIHYIGNWKKNEGTKISQENAAEVAAKIMLFGVALRNITRYHKSEYSSKPFNTTFSELQNILNESNITENKLDLAEYFQVLTGGLKNTMDYENDVIIVSNLPYFVRLVELLGKEKTETVQQYVWWSVITTVLPYSNAVLQNYRHQFLEELLGTLQRTPRSTICLKQVKALLPMSLGYGMAKKHSITKTIEKVEEMFEDIRQSFHSMVRDVSWMDDETKKATLDKANAVTSFIGYPEWLLEPGKLDEYYDGIELVAGQYMWNVLRIKADSVSDLLETIGKEDSNNPIDTWESIDPIQVNAFYTRLTNSIIIPAGILQVPFYGREHEALNYGAIGAILGHELTHGFDSDGKNYDKHGNRVSWWSDKMVQEYNKREECFVKQYSRFKFNRKMKVDGKNTLAENIADNGGLREAFQAYQRFKKRNGPQPKLIGLEEFSNEQLLFLSYANLWCHNTSPRYDKAILKDKHSPAMFRVLGTLSNTVEFAQAWNCPAKSEMNPKNKCVIW